MRCESIFDDLQAFLDNELESERHQEIERHLAECTDCTKMVEDLAQLSNMLQIVDDIPAPNLPTAKEILVKAQPPRAGWLLSIERFFSSLLNFRSPIIATMAAVLVIMIAVGYQQLFLKSSQKATETTAKQNAPTATSPDTLAEYSQKERPNTTEANKDANTGAGVNSPAPSAPTQSREAEKPSLKGQSKVDGDLDSNLQGGVEGGVTGGVVGGVVGSVSPEPAPPPPPPADLPKSQPLLPKNAEKQADDQAIAEERNNKTLNETAPTSRAEAKNEVARRSGEADELAKKKSASTRDFEDSSGAVSSAKSSPSPSAGARPGVGGKAGAGLAASARPMPKTVDKVEVDRGVKVPSKESAIGNERVVVKSVQLSLETATFDDVKNRTGEKVKAVGGFVSSWSDNSQTAGSRTAQIILKVPVDRFDTLLSEIHSLGKISKESIKRDDVTNQYKDLSERIALLKQKEQETLTVDGRANKPDSQDAKSSERAKRKDDTRVQPQDSLVRQRMMLERQREQIANDAKMSTITILLIERINK